MWEFEVPVDCPDFKRTQEIQEIDARHGAHQFSDYRQRTRGTGGTEGMAAAIHVVPDERCRSG